MKKVVRTSLNNVANKRGVRDLNIQLYSHDNNNAGFEFVIKNEVDLSEYKAKVLFDFQESFATWETKGTIEGNVVKVKFDTTFITKCEEVIGYLFLDSETDTLDVFKFKFNVVLSEIDKYDTTKRGFRYIKDQEVVDVITRSELEEEIKKLQVNSGIDLSSYLTTSVANETFATKQELSTYATKDELPSVSGLVTTEQLTVAKNSVVEEISNKGYVTSTVAEETYAKKSDLPAPYNDSALAERVTNLENRTDRDTVYNDTEVKERLTTLENKPPVDLSNYATKEELANVSGNQLSVDNLVTKDELTGKNYLTTTVAEETYALKSEIPQPYNDSTLNERVTALENRPTTGGSVDTSNLVTKAELKEKEDDIYDAIHRNPLYEVYTEDTLTEHLNNGSSSNYTNVDSRGGIIYSNSSHTETNIFKGDVNKEKVVDFQTAMFTVANSIPDNYSLANLLYPGGEDKKVTFLSNKNFSEVVPKEELKAIIREAGVSTGESIDTSNFATKEELAKAVTKQELEEKHYVTNEQISSTYATKSEIPQLYSDIELVKRITVLENRQDNDTVYDDAELKRRVTALEEKPNVDTSNFVTNEVLDNKGYLTQHQDLSDYALKSELYNDTYLNNRIGGLENEVSYRVRNIENIENRVEGLENKLREYDGIDSIYATKDELRVKDDEFNSKFVLKDDLRRLVSEIVTELKSENN